MADESHLNGGKWNFYFYKFDYNISRSVVLVRVILLTKNNMARCLAVFHNFVDD